MNTRLLQTAVAVLLCAGCRQTGLFSAGGRPGNTDAPAIVHRGDADRGPLGPSGLQPARAPNDIVQAGGWNVDEPSTGVQPAAHATISASESEALLAHLNQGRHEEQQGQFERARAAYSQVLAVYPDHPEAHHRLGVIADKFQQYETAQAHYQIALRGTPNDPVVLSDLGYSLLLQQRFDESERTLLRAAAVSNPPYRKALLNLGLLHATRGEYDRALATFRQVGTEEQAQARMQALFPDGRPQGNPSLAGTQIAVPDPPNGDGSAQPELAQLLEDMRQERTRAQQTRAGRDQTSAADHSAVTAPPFPDLNASMIQAAATAPPSNNSGSVNGTTQPPNAPQGDPRRVPVDRLNDLFAAIDARDPNAGSTGTPPSAPATRSSASGNGPAEVIPKINAAATVPIAAPAPQSLPIGVAADPLDSMETWPPESSDITPWATGQAAPTANDFSSAPASGSIHSTPAQHIGIEPPVQPVGHVTPTAHDPADYAATVVGMDVGFGGLFPLLQSAPSQPVTATVQRFPGTPSHVGGSSFPAPMRTLPGHRMLHEPPQTFAQPTPSSRQTTAPADEAPPQANPFRPYQTDIEQHDAEYQRILRQLEQERHLPPMPAP